MTRIDILTDAGLYVGLVEPTDYTLIEEAPTENRLFDLVRRDVLSGCYFYGWTPHESPEMDVPSLVAIEKGARVKSCRMYEYTPVGVEGFNADATPTPSTAYPFTCNGEYLLPIFVNDKPATDYMKTAALSQQIQLCKEAEGIAPTEYLIIIPDVWLEPVAAADYLTDYVREVEPMTTINGGGKAKAWPGWSE